MATNKKAVVVAKGKKVVPKAPVKVSAKVKKVSAKAPSRVAPKAPAPKANPMVPKKIGLFRKITNWFTKK